jgi:hypothetical protein
MSSVAPPMSEIDSINNARRPMRSPTGPSISAPMGRAMKPSANTAKASSNWDVALDCGKNCRPMSLAK